MGMTCKFAAIHSPKNRTITQLKTTAAMWHCSLENVHIACALNANHIECLKLSSHPFHLSETTKAMLCSDTQCSGTEISKYLMSCVLLH